MSQYTTILTPSKLAIMEVFKILVFVYINGDSPSFLSASASSNAFITEMWPSRTIMIDVVVRTSEIIFDQFCKRRSFIE